jgi:hypothetical protein
MTSMDTSGTISGYRRDDPGVTIREWYGESGVFEIRERVEERRVFAYVVIQRREKDGRCRIVGYGSADTSELRRSSADVMAQEYDRWHSWEWLKEGLVEAFGHLFTGLTALVLVLLYYAFMDWTRFVYFAAGFPVGYLYLRYRMRVAGIASLPYDSKTSWNE